MTPTWQGPLSEGPGGFALILAFGAGFLTAGLTAAAAGVAAVAGWPCAHADAAKHDKAHATTNTRTIKSPENDRLAFKQRVYLDRAAHIRKMLCVGPSIGSSLS
jgi:hypothetical protein